MQPQGHVQILSNLLDYGMDPQDALDSPRFCIADGHADGRVYFEDGISEEIVNELIAMGHVTGREIIRNVDDLWPEIFYDLGIVKSKFLKTILDFFAYISYKVPKMIIPVSEGYVNTITNKYKTTHIVKVKTCNVLSFVKLIRIILYIIKNKIIRKINPLSIRNPL